MQFPMMQQPTLRPVGYALVPTGQQQPRQPAFSGFPQQQFSPQQSAFPMLAQFPNLIGQFPQSFGQSPQSFFPQQQMPQFRPPQFGPMQPGLPFGGYPSQVGGFGQFGPAMAGGFPPQQGGFGQFGPSMGSGNRVDFRPVIVQNQSNSAPLGSAGINATMSAQAALGYNA